MARKKIEIFLEINNEKEFEKVIKNNMNNIICVEVYSRFVGSCTALDRLFTQMKLDWSNGKMVLLKVPSDDIPALERFRNQSEPVFIFLYNGKVTKVLRGVNGIKMAEVAKAELRIFKMLQEGAEIDRPSYELDEPTPDEMEWISFREVEKKQEAIYLAACRSARQAARKRHRAELMLPHLLHLNFVLYWPHAKHAHPELYERWDLNNIIMVGREDVVLSKDLAEDVLYAGDAPLNEASLHKLLSGPALAICFRLLDTDKHFVSLVRNILYEELPVIQEDKSINEHPPWKTAFDLYKTYSPTREEVYRRRKEEKTRRREEELEKRARRLSEMQRLARQAIEDAKEARKKEKENRKLELLKTGNLAALDELENEIEEDINIVIPEELPEPMEESTSEEEDEDEYIPPAGLVIPGFYAPPNDIAKVNGLVILFPKIVHEYVTPQPELLPPHVLVMLNVTQRYTALDIMKKHRSKIIHMGIFKGDSPTNAVHVAYSVLQYDGMNLQIDEADLRLCFMLSTLVDIPLLELMDLNPRHVSRDQHKGEDECAALFPVDYGDIYPEFEDFGDHTVLVE